MLPGLSVKENWTSPSKETGLKGVSVAKELHLPAQANVIGELDGIGEIIRMRYKSKKYLCVQFEMFFCQKHCLFFSETF